MATIQLPAARGRGPHSSRVLPIRVGSWTVPTRLLVLLGAVVLAYPYTLGSLVRSATEPSPLAYVGLVPILALALAWLRLRREPRPLPIHDRHVDYIVGLWLVGVAAGLALLLPGTVGPTFWLNRLDVLSLPFFVAGLVSLLYGVRRTWALGREILFLFLAWPVLGLPVVGEAVRWSIDATAAVLAGVSSILPLARPLQGNEGVFAVGASPGSFLVDVTAAHSGANSVVGFLLVGVALATAMHGSWVRRIAWIAAGVLLVWVANLLRVQAAFVAGAAVGEGAAGVVLHPLAGLLVFGLAVAAMISLLPESGLRFKRREPNAAAGHPSPVRRPVGAAVAIAVIALVLGAMNSGLSRFEAIASDVGEPLLTAFEPEHALPAGWTVQPVEVLEAPPLVFGETTTWERYEAKANGDADLQASVPIYLDRISTTDQAELDRYGVEAAYEFRGDGIVTSESRDIGAGVPARLVTYESPGGDRSWSVLAWDWPYQEAGETRFERLALLVTDASGASFQFAQSGARLASAGGTDEAEAFLVELGREVVSSQLTARRVAGGR